jgi:hypothetical protein
MRETEKMARSTQPVRPETVFAIRATQAKQFDEGPEYHNASDEVGNTACSTELTHPQTHWKWARSRGHNKDV